MALDLTKPNMSAASVATVMTDIRANLAALASYNWTPYSIAYSDLSNAASRSNGCLYKITGTGDQKTINIYGDHVFAWVQDGFQIITGSPVGNVINAPMTIKGQSLILITRSGSYVMVHPIGYHTENEYLRESVYNKNVGLASFETYGDTALASLGGTWTNNYFAEPDPTGEWIRILTSSGGYGGVSGYAGNLGRRLIFEAVVRPPGSLLNTRMWVGLSNTPLHSIQNLNNITGTAFYYGSGEGSDYWKFRTNNGSATDNSITTTWSAGLTYSKSLLFRIELEPRLGSSYATAKGYINGNLVGTFTGSTDKVTTALTGTYFYVSTYATSAVQVDIYISKLRLLRA